MNRWTSGAASALLSALSFPFSSAEAELVRRGLCTKGDVTREIELRSVVGATEVCDIVERTVGESTEERTLHPAAARSEFCATRFESAARSLSRDGWRCSVEPRASTTDRREPSATRSPPRSEAKPFASSWRDACTAAHTTTGTGDPETLCDCAIEVLSEAGFEERDFEVLVSPYDEPGLERPVHRAGLLYGVGMMAVDALARCGAP